MILKFKKTIKKNKYIHLFVYQRNDTLGLVHCNSNLLAVAQQYVCYAVRYPEKINTDY
jgi:hypothetical protein